VLAPCDAPPPKFPAGLEAGAACLAGAEGFLSLPAWDSAPVPKSAATISAAEPFLITLRRVDKLIEILNSLISVGPQVCGTARRSAMVDYRLRAFSLHMLTLQLHGGWLFLEKKATLRPGFCKEQK
jgi:hypothetical protein